MDFRWVIIQILLTFVQALEKDIPWRTREPRVVEILQAVRDYPFVASPFPYSLYATCYIVFMVLIGKLDHFVPVYNRLA